MSATTLTRRYAGSTALTKDKMSGRVTDVSDRKWIQKAVPPERRGVFTRKAKRAGMGVQEFASKVRGRKRKGKPVPTELLREAILAQRFKKMASKRKAG